MISLSSTGCTEVSEHGFRSLLEVCPDLRALSVTDASLSSVAFRTVCAKLGISLHLAVSWERVAGQPAHNAG